MNVRSITGQPALPRTQEPESNFETENSTLALLRHVAGTVYGQLQQALARPTGERIEASRSANPASPQFAPTHPKRDVSSSSSTTGYNSLTPDRLRSAGRSRAYQIQAKAQQQFEDGTLSKEGKELVDVVVRRPTQAHLDRGYPHPYESERPKVYSLSITGTTASLNDSHGSHFSNSSFNQQLHGPFVMVKRQPDAQPDDTGTYVLYVPRQGLKEFGSENKLKKYVSSSLLDFRTKEDANWATAQGGAVTSESVKFESGPSDQNFFEHSLEQEIDKAERDTISHPPSDISSSSTTGYNSLTPDRLRSAGRSRAYQIQAKAQQQFEDGTLSKEGKELVDVVVRRPTQAHLDRGYPHPYESERPKVYSLSITGTTASLNDSHGSHFSNSSFNQQLHGPFVMVKRQPDAQPDDTGTYVLYVPRQGLKEFGSENELKKYVSSSLLDFRTKEDANWATAQGGAVTSESVKFESGPSDQNFFEHSLEQEIDKAERDLG
ncbi:dermonecrotic toxin domain-containing protein [Burkholderia ubonensis]|uniref:dermonecrotic toxin domain-containing protein n=1 Tax=Burkholderia ubonensis TaxID=101571 RepID=UPI000AA151CC|nr:DUF6543 domain-containing protein [Burkholderia ubonensis]